MKGIGGAVFKPISGVLDMVSKTTEGIKNNLNVNHKNIIANRIYPRALYGKYKIIKEYNLMHSQVIYLLINKINIKNNNEFNFYDCDLFKDINKENNLIVFIENGLYIYNLNKNILKNNIEYKNIFSIFVEENENKITIKLQNNKKIIGSTNKMNNLIIYVFSEEEFKSEECNIKYAKKIYDKICEYKKYFQNEDML